MFFAVGMKKSVLACAMCTASPICLKWSKTHSTLTSGNNIIVHVSTASRAHRTLALPFSAASPAGQTHWCTARTLFDGWKAAKVNANESAATNTEGPGVASAQTQSATDNVSTAAASEAGNEVKQLRQQIMDLKEALEASQETVKQLLVLTSTQTASASTAPSKQCEPCGGAARAAKSARGACYVVRTSEELVDALRGRGSEHASRTILLDGKLFLIDLYGRVEVDQARVSIVGNNATVIGHISVKGRGAVLAASDVFFLCPYDLELRQNSGNGKVRNSTNGNGNDIAATAAAMPVNTTGKQKENAANLRPVISATAGAGIHLDRCVLSNGRDGVYLGMGSHCTLNRVRIVNCIRGLYEGVGCRTSMIDGCTFQANRYHMVLLGPGSAERANQLFKKETTMSSSSRAAGTHTTAATFTVSFSPSATAADVLAPGVSSTSVISVQQTKAQIVLQHNPITDTYEDCWSDGQRVELTATDATAGLSDPVF